MRRMSAIDAIVARQQTLPATVLDIVDAPNAGLARYMYVEGLGDQWCHRLPNSTAEIVPGGEQRSP
jgi:hypothetical protein